MIRQTLQIGVLTLVFVHANALGVGTGGEAAIKNAGDEKKSLTLDESKMDPAAFFDSLIERYRGLSDYRDRAHLVQITRRPGFEDLVSEFDLLCTIVDGELEVLTPQEQLRSEIKLDLPFRKSDAMRELELRYRLWLAPHLVLKFAADPRAELREGVQEGFTPTLAERIVENDRSFVHLELRSGGGGCATYNAKFDFYVNPESMLIERIVGLQHLPDGSSLLTTLDIFPEIKGAIPAGLLSS